jgi:5'(3')-deoxyribonucleotidase
MQEPAENNENKNLFDPMEAWGSVKINGTRTPKNESATFTVGLWAGLWCGLCMLVATLLAMGMPAGSNASEFTSSPGFRTGEIIGAGFAVFMFSYIIGWLFWRLTGKKRGGGRIAFAVTAGLLMLSQFSQMSVVAGQKQAIDDVMQAYSQIRAQELRYTPEYPKTEMEIPAYIDKVLEQFDLAATAQSKADAKRQLRFAQMRTIATSRLRMETEYAVSQQGVVSNLEQKAGFFRSEKNIELVRKNVEDLRSAGEQYLKAAVEFPSFVSLTMTEEAFPGGVIGGFDEGVRMATTSLTDELSAWVQSNNDFADAGLKMAMLFSANKNKWHSDSNDQIIFHDQATMDEFNAAQAEFLARNRARVDAVSRVNAARTSLRSGLPK